MESNLINISSETNEENKTIPDFEISSPKELDAEDVTSHFVIDHNTSRKFSAAEKGKQKELSEHSRNTYNGPRLYPPDLADKPASPAGSSVASPRISPNLDALKPPLLNASPKSEKSAPSSARISYPLKTVMVPCCIEDEVSRTDLTKDVSAIMQTQNGPCPLLALVNYCILKGKLRFPRDKKFVEFEDVMEALGDLLLREQTRELSADSAGNAPKNLDAVLQVLPTLQSGLDVNVQFGDIFGFEETPATLVFKALGIQLCHGWLADSENALLFDILHKQESYNGLATHLVALQEPSAALSDSQMAEKLTIQQFLIDDAPSQMTEYGLNQLRTQLPPNFLGALFWNNHFHVVWKHKDSGALFVLVTDDGYRDAENIVWQSIDSFHGDGSFYTGTCEPVPRDSLFAKSPHTTNDVSALRDPPPAINPRDTGKIEHEQINNDFALALQIQQMDVHSGNRAENEKDQPKKLQRKNFVKSDSKTSPSAGKEELLKKCLIS